MTRSQLKSRIIAKLAGDTVYLAIDTDLNDLIDDSIDEIGKETPLQDNLITFNSVFGQQEYNIPDNIFKIFSVTWKNIPLDEITYAEATRQFGEYDVLITTTSLIKGPPNEFYTRLLTVDPSITTTPGLDPNVDTPSQLVLGTYPIPDEVQTFKISAAFRLPHLVADTDTPQIPLPYHKMIVDYVIGELYEKSKEFNTGQFFKNRYEQKLMEYRQWILTLQPDQVVETVDTRL